jgi:predicted flap endonuclease-1-like 5' DNA nuclease
MRGGPALPASDADGFARDERAHFETTRDVGATRDVVAASSHDAASTAPSGDSVAIATEKARLIRAWEAEAARVNAALRACAAATPQLLDFAEERRALLRDTASLRGQVARYRQVVIDLEDNAPPPILGERGAPDDLKLIVGIGPVLERMLQQLGVASYRQIARWSEHDIDVMDARLPEFPGRIRRDAWVTQARALHQSKYGERA